MDENQSPEGLAPARARSRELAEFEAQVEAIRRTQAVIEFELDGTILAANDLFLDAMGYSLGEVQGRHHRIFVDAETAASAEYREFWASLARGEARNGEFRRISRAGADVWIQATYTPIRDESGRPYKVVKFATDITDQKVQNADFQGQIEAIRRTQAVIEFELDGTILVANDLFLDAMGYTLDEVRGRHHRIFVDAETASSAEYREFWASLARGEARNGEFRRRSKAGADVWIQATYTPVRDAAGRAFKVVKFASDITDQKVQNADFQGQIEAIRRTQAVISFTPGGEILEANDLFLGVMGYTLDEVRGRHHRIFVTPETSSSQAYQDFWADLARGEHKSGNFGRIGKGGREVWIQATYTPILDLRGRTVKVVKFARDITQEVDGERQLEAILRAVAEGDLDRRMEVEKYQGSMRAMGEAVNRLVDTVVSPVRQVIGAARGLAEGDLTQTIDGEFGGDFLAMQQAFNTFIQVNRGIISDLSRILARMQAGQLEQVFEADYPGDYRDLEASLRAFLAFNRSMMGDLLRVAGDMSEGDLTTRLEAEFPGDFSRLRESFTSALESLNEVLAQTQVIAQEVDQASVELRSTSRAMAEVAQRQSESTEDSAASLEQASAMVRATAENSEAASALMAQTSQAAQDGRGKMEEMTGAISAIEESSRHISKIIKVIDEIAFQTNLLALNAAVEAARAGRHGKGFAVVAQEVRSLAGRSASAAKETADLISESTRKVEHGVEISNRTSQAFEQIVENVTQVTDLVSQITSASQEQNLGIANVSREMGRVQKGALETLEQGAELAAASDELSRQTEVLSEAVGRFKIKDDAARPLPGGGSSAADLLAPYSPQMIEDALRAIYRDADALRRAGTPESKD